MHFVHKIIRQKFRLGSPIGGKNKIKMIEFVNRVTKSDAFIPGKRKVKFEVSLSLGND